MLCVLFGCHAFWSGFKLLLGMLLLPMDMAKPHCATRVTMASNLCPDCDAHAFWDPFHPLKNFQFFFWNGFQIPFHIFLKRNSYSVSQILNFFWWSGVCDPFHKFHKNVKRNLKSVSPSFMCFFANGFWDPFHMFVGGAGNLILIALLGCVLGCRGWGWGCMVLSYHLNWVTSSNNMACTP